MKWKWKDLELCSKREATGKLDSNLQFFQGGIDKITVYQQSNLLALIPSAYPWKMILFDEDRVRVVYEVEIPDNLLNVGFVGTNLVATSKDKLFVFKLIWKEDVLVDLQNIHEFDTENPLGILTLAQGEKSAIAFPGRLQGQAKIVHLSNTIPSSSLLACHNSSLALISLSPDATHLATCSTRGTLIRIFSLASSNLVRELRRGSDQAKILSISWSMDGKWLAVTSDKGTLHVWNLHEPRQVTEEPTSPLKTVQAIGKTMPYFQSEWSFAKYTLPIDVMEKHITFVSHFLPHAVQPIQSKSSSKAPSESIHVSLILICSDGAIYLISFDTRHGGQAWLEWFGQIE